MLFNLKPENLTPEQIARLAEAERFCPSDVIEGWGEEFLEEEFPVAKFCRGAYNLPGKKFLVVRI